MVVAVTAVGCFWATPVGQFLLSRVYLAGLLVRLPWNLPSFLYEVTRVGIMVYDGAAYRFAHNFIYNWLISEPFKLGEG